MTPPEAPDLSAGITPPAALVRLETIKSRPDFLACARARRAPAGSFLLQGRDRGDGSPAIRVGITASKKIGNAVTRNRAKRRLRALARAVLPVRGKPGWDYVLVARPGETVGRAYADLEADLSAALGRLHRTQSS